MGNRSHWHEAERTLAKVAPAWKRQPESQLLLW